MTTNRSKTVAPKGINLRIGQLATVMWSRCLDAPLVDLP